MSTTITGASPSHRGALSCPLDRKHLEAIRARNPVPDVQPTAALVAMWTAPRCSAMRKDRQPCKSPAIKGRKTCRMHSGGKTAGPSGKANGRFKHGHETKQAIAARQRAQAMLGAISTDAEGQPVAIDWNLAGLLLKALEMKEPRAMKRVRNQAAWNAGDRRAWGGEDRRGQKRRKGFVRP